jgi:predicted nucleic acid-binding protein
MTIGLLDTSVFIATETGRRMDTASLPRQSAVSAVTIGELRWGVLMAEQDVVRSRRLDTLRAAEQLEPIPIDGQVAAAWALLRRQLVASGKKMEINDSWIAATAIAHGFALLTQDRGFPTDVGGLTVIAV